MGAQPLLIHILAQSAPVTLYLLYIRKHPGMAYPFVLQFHRGQATVESAGEAIGWGTRGSVTSMTVPYSDVLSTFTEPP